MDAITAKVPADTTLDTEFLVYTDDFDSRTSLPGLACQLGTISYEVRTPNCARPHVRTRLG